MMVIIVCYFLRKVNMKKCIITERERERDLTVYIITYQSHTVVVEV